MPKRLRFPRNEASRRDRIAQSDIPFKQARNVASRNDAISGSALGSDAALTIALTGTVITEGVTEEQIVDGGETVIITISGDTWAPTLGSDNAITTAFLAAITGDDDGANGFDDEVTLAHGNLVRDSATQLTLTIPAAASYSVTGDEIVTIAPPSSSVNKGIAPAPATFTISDAVTITLSGTAVAAGVLESEIVAGGETLIITLAGDTWHEDLGSDNAITTAFLAAITGDDDYSTVAAATDYEDVARTSDTIATITYPAVAGYSIASDETVTVAIDLDTVAGSINIKSKTFTITAE